MYGLIVRLRSTPGNGRALASILLDGVRSSPGCLSYIVAHDEEDADILWVTEVWEDQASHQASLSRPSVQRAIATGRPLIEDFIDRWVTSPITTGGE